MADGEVGKWGRWVRAVHDYYSKSWWWKYVWYHLLLATGPLLLGLAKFVPFLDTFFHKYPLLAVVAGAFPLIASPLKGWSEHLRKSDKPDSRAFAIMADEIDNIVGLKLNTLFKVIKKLEKIGFTSPGLALREAIQPDPQIRSIVEGIYKFFKAWLIYPLNKEVNIQVVLAHINNDRVDEWVYFLPNDRVPRSQPGDFKSKNCGFSRAVEQRRLVIVPDTSVEARKKGDRNYDAIHEQHETEAHSLLCYPIYDARFTTVPYVLSIRADEKNFFTDAARAGLQLVLEHFAKRILLEHYATRILEVTANDPKIQQSADISEDNIPA